MSLLKPAENTFAYLKMGLFGDTGSGKTWTASQTALGLHKYIDSKKPVAFFDTEGGSDFVVPIFKKAGIEMLVHKGRALVDLSQIVKEAEQSCSILIIDSITHVWEEFTDSYLKKSKQRFIELWDWKPIKAEWKNTFTVPFLNSKLHIIMNGREGAIYGNTEEVRGGQVKKVTVKVGEKMAAEAQTGYEPNLLCQMDKLFKEGDGTYVRSCHVVKERFGVIDSKTFENPTFKDFLPHIEMLNLKGSHEGIDITRTSEDMFDSPDNSWNEKRRQVEIAVEELQEALILAGLDGTSTEAKQKRTNLLIEIFGTSSKTAIESLPLEKLKAGVALIRAGNSVAKTGLNSDETVHVTKKAVNEIIRAKEVAHA